MKAENKKVSRRTSSEIDKTLGRLVKAPETAFLIFEFAESLYLRNETAERMTFTDLEKINEFLKRTDDDMKRIKSQFQELAEIEGDFQSKNIPVGF